MKGKILDVYRNNVEGGAEKLKDTHTEIEIEEIQRGYEES